MTAHVGGMGLRRVGRIRKTLLEGVGGRCLQPEVRQHTHCRQPDQHVAPHPDPMFCLAHARSNMVDEHKVLCDDLGSPTCGFPDSLLAALSA
ncbi:hypothetical protein E2C01_053975 [Portunus trituberculatus]|uniref:Uncharacterized protein n=1 Tax=Portunus trituberculatus TaxID=210409 RepID=A0A5B7GLW5_PORTR|nr:hypothetical protein [Portunus trituberculatus]